MKFIQLTKKYFINFDLVKTVHLHESCCDVIFLDDRSITLTDPLDIDGISRFLERSICVEF